MKQLLITILAAALLVVCFAGFPVIRYMLSFYTYEIKELITPSKSSKLKLVGMSIYRAAETGNTEAIKKHGSHVFYSGPAQLLAPNPNPTLGDAGP